MSRGSVLCPLCGQRGSAAPFLSAPDRFNARKQQYELVRCGECSLVWTHNPPPPEEMAGHYGQSYDATISSIGENEVHERWRQPRNLLLRYKSSGALLDIGCSSGGFLASIDRQAWRVSGIEMSGEVAARARRNLGAEVFAGDILDAPFAGGSFDAITCFHVLEHVYDPRAVLAKIREWLKPDGVAIVYLPNIQSGAARLFKSYWYALEVPRHLYHFSPETLRQMAASAGLKDVSLALRREPFIEASLRYLKDAAFEKLGRPYVPMAQAPQPGVPWRVLRKAWRLTALPVLERMVGIGGPGEVIQAVFARTAQPSTAARECRETVPRGAMRGTR